jgi:hypothetical protein
MSETQPKQPSPALDAAGQCILHDARNPSKLLKVVIIEGRGAVYVPRPVGG